MTPLTVNLRAYREAPFVEAAFALKGMDLSAASFVFQARPKRGVGGTPPVDLVTASAGSEGVSCEVITADGVIYSVLTVQIDKATINATLPYPANGQKAGTDVALDYDLKVDDWVLPETRLFEGTLTIHEAAAQ